MVEQLLSKLVCQLPAKKKRYNEIIFFTHFLNISGLNKSTKKTLLSRLATMQNFEEDVFQSETGFSLNLDFDLLTVLSGERVSQMTKTYADADALQKLLEEVN